MKRVLLIILLVFLAKVSSAQQLPLYSQYLYNKFLINPAHAGSDGYTSLNITARQQWLGYSGAPRTFSLSWQTRFLKKGYEIRQNVFNGTKYKPKTSGHVGFGAYVFSDRNGLIERTGFQTAYSYHFWIQDYTQLSFGLALNGYFFRANVTESNFLDPNEPWLNNDLRRGIFVPNADFGVYLLNPKYDLGFSAQQLFGSTIIIGSHGNSQYLMYRHYYLFGSYRFRAGESSEIQPSLLLKTSEKLAPQADLGLTYLYDQRLCAGLAYRTGGAIIANFNFRYIPNKIEKVAIFFGYAIDFTLNKIQSVTYGTHEITVAVKFGDSAKRYRWLDRY